MVRRKSVGKFEIAVKPYFYPTERCYIIYSPSKELSKKSSFELLSKKQVKAKFGFELLCDDLLRSEQQLRDYMEKHEITVPFPRELAYLNNYLVETNTLNLFIVHQTSAKSGFGISTYSALPKGRIIAEYVGERKSYYGLNAFSDNTYVLISDDGTKIDAKDYGNVARFFNHCPSKHHNPNVLTANLLVLPWKSSEKLTKAIFITLRDIKAFEPLCWDYGDDYDFNNGVELLDSKTYQPLVGESETGNLCLDNFCNLAKFVLD